MRTQEVNQALVSTTPGRGPAYRIHTRRLLLRCWEPGDAPLLMAALTANLEHLRPWLLWTQHEPEDLQAKIERLRRYRGAFDLSQDFFYGLFNREESDGRPRDAMVWTRLAHEYPTSPAATADVEAFDVVGRKLL